MLSLILIPISIIIFRKLNRNYQFVIFSITALYPLSFGNLGSIPYLFVIEWLTIVVFLSLINQLVPLYSFNKKLKTLKFKGIGIFIFAFSILIIWSIVSYINNEILAQINIIGAETRIKRLYFDMFNNILLFFTTVIFFASQYEKISVEKFLKAILYVTLLIGFVRIYTFLHQIDTPLVAGFFNYNTGGVKNVGGVAQRFAGLDYATMIGIPALFGLYVYKNKLNFFLLIIFLVFLFLSGSRTVMVGFTLSIVIFSFLFLPKNFIYFIVSGCILFLIAVIFLPQTFFEGQVTRLSSFQNAGFLGQDIWRGTAWYLYLKSFIANPIFGKGISDYTGFIYSSFPGTEHFVRQQLFSGGHGAYFSLLGIFGIGGITYFVILVYGGIILSFKKIKQYAAFNQDKTAIAIFCFMLLIISAVYSITGPNGFSDVPHIFYTVGLICAIRVMENSSEKIQDKNENYSSKIEINNY